MSSTKDIEVQLQLLGYNREMFNKVVRKMIDSNSVQKFKDGLEHLIKNEQDELN